MREGKCGVPQSVVGESPEVEPIMLSASIPKGQFGSEGRNAAEGVTGPRDYSRHFECIYDAVGVRLLSLHSHRRCTGALRAK